MNTGRFLKGMLLGIGLTLGLALIPAYLVHPSQIMPVLLDQLPRLQALGGWLYRNLGLSLIPFTLTFLLYLTSLRRLARQLEQEEAAADEIAQSEQLSDVWISLFFGIGVIWTAIGMRSALLHALGDPDAAAGSAALLVLQRLVEGGILTALSTTIVGGVGGYLMRLVKSVYLGARLSRYYGLRERHQASRIEQRLEAIQQALGPASATEQTANARQQQP